MRKFLYILAIMAFFSSFWAVPANSAVTLPWSTSFNCADWTQSDGLTTSAFNCSGISPWGAWTCSGNESQITTSANYPAGAGGKGFRAWFDQGKNVNSGAMRVELSSPEPELWIRWYMRYDKNFYWNYLQGDKWIIIDFMQPTQTYVGWKNSDQLTFRVYQSGVQNYLSNNGTGWQSVMGNLTSDGQWHSYEIHIKMDTNGTDGVAEIWIDGVKKVSHTNINFTTAAGFSDFILLENKDNVGNVGCQPVDYDDIVISKTGYIGPIADPLSPAAPSNLLAN